MDHGQAGTYNYGLATACVVGQGFVSCKVHGPTATKEDRT